MEKNIVSITLKIFIVLGCLGAQVYAHDLSAYRSKDGGDAQKALERGHALVQSLGLTGEPPRVQPTIRGRRHVIVSSSIFKNQLQKVIEGLYQEATFGNPMTFDPSVLTLDQADAKYMDHQRQLFLKLIDGRLSEFIDVYEKDVVLNGEDRTQGAIDGVASIAHLAEMKSIETKLGAPKHAVIEEGSFQKILFGSGIDLSFSMLVTYRTGRDDHFIRVIQFVFDEVKTRREKADEDVKSKDGSFQFFWTQKSLDALASAKDLAARLKKVEESLLSKWEGAIRNHELLDLLTAQEIHWLLALFISSRGADIPIESDIQSMRDKLIAQEGFKEKDWEIGEDYRFYTQVHRELSALENHLRMEKENQTSYQEILEKIRKGKK